MNRYISDLHFGHANVIRFDDRPFSDVVAMEDALIQNWNSVTDPNDTVYILGDFCWGKEDEWKRILPQLRRTRSSRTHNCGNIFNVGCMMPYMGYTPRTLDEIIDGVSHSI